MASKKRDHLVDVARDLFYRHGFHATGVDTILKEAGVARMTLYKHFKSKEELILATLELQDEQFREWLVAAVERQAKRPSDRLLAVFDAFGELFRSDSFFGCAFIKASGEYPNLQDPVHQLAVRHKEMIQSYLRGLAAEAGAKNADTLSKQLILLVDGAIATAQVTGRAGAADDARAAAEVLVQNAIANNV